VNVTFKNFGAVEKGEIGLRPLTLLCGENNTGKTYAMYALCGLLGLRHTPRLSVLDAELELLVANGSIEVDLGELLKPQWHSVEQRFCSALKGMLGPFFSAEANVFEHASFTASNGAEPALELIRDAELEATSEASGGKTLLRAQKLRGTLMLKVTLTGKLPIEMVASLLAQLIGRVVFAPWSGKVFLLPAERAGLNLFYRELNRQRTALLHHASKPQLDLGALFRDMIARYPQPIADYIDILNDLTNLKRKKGFHHELALEIQKSILGIKKYQIDREGNISFLPRKTDVPLNLHLGSSTVKSLFGLWFYLEHLSEEGDFLMIDEPELNLHPANQRVMACIIARLVNRGTKVMLTTHSDYFVRQINHLIMLGNAGEKGKEAAAKHGFHADALLSGSQVAAYLFKGKGIQRMEMDEEEGIIAETFDDVIRGLNKDSQEIYWQTLHGAE